MGIFSKLLGSEKVIDAAYNGVDKAFYTEEERADDRKLISKVKIELLNAYAPFKVAQRGLSILFGVPYVLGWSATFVMSFFNEDVSKQVSLLNGDIGGIVWTIIGFYFFGGAAESIGRKVVSSQSVKNRPVG